MNTNPSGCDVADRIADAATPHEAEVMDGILGVDPGCRYLGDPATYPHHQCHRNSGEMVRWGEACHAEARAQLRDAARVCLTCGGPIPDGGCIGGAVVADGRSFSFHCGDCFARSDEAVAAFVEAHPLCGYCGVELLVLDLPSQRWIHDTPSPGCRMPFPTSVAAQARAAARVVR